MMVLAALPAAIAGCNPDGGPDDEAFGIVSITYDNDSTITLTFTQPVAELGEVDPNNFRLSRALTQTITYTYDGMPMTYEYTSYSAIGLFTPESEEYLTFTSIARGASATELILEGSLSFGEVACAWVEYVTDEIEMNYLTGEYAEYYSDVRFEVGIFLHYAAGDIPIENEDGDALANIGADWVTNPENDVYSYAYGFMMLTPKLEIPCP